MVVTLFMILLFMFLILIHEFGHFIAAKMFNIKVNEFSIGMGKLLLSRKRGETQYSLRAIPVGGYCKLEGEDRDNDDPRSFRNTHPIIKILVILAGPTINFLFGVLLFIIIHYNIGLPTTEINSIMDNSPALEIGIEEGDVILSYNGESVSKFEDFIDNFNKFYIENNSNIKSKIKIKRNDNILEYEFKPMYKNNSPLLGVEVKTKSLGLGESIIQAFKTSVGMVEDIFNSLKTIGNQKINISGPVGLIDSINKDTKGDTSILDLLNMVAYISINLFFFNLIPFPLLDGWKILESIIEIILKRPIKEKVSTLITAIGGILLIALILTITLKDIVNIVLK